jgi:DNA-binding transcriptional LysR family regulator
MIPENGTPNRDIRIALRDFDLNLLVILHELLRHSSVTKAAESLGLSQSAVSNALNRLRKILGDDLFLRTSRGITPTRLAESMTGPITHALETILRSTILPYSIQTQVSDVSMLA